MLDDSSVEKRLVTVLQADQMDVTLQVRGLGAIIIENTRNLFFDGVHVRRQQAGQAQHTALVFGKSTALVV